MGRCLPFLFALSLSTHAQVRHTLDAPARVNIDAIARARVRPAATRPTPRPKRIPSRRAIRAVGPRSDVPDVVAPGTAAYGGFQGLLDVYEATPPRSEE